MKSKLFLDNIIFSLQNAGGISVYWSELLSHFMDREDFEVIQIDHGGAQNNIFFQQVASRPRKTKKEMAIPLAVKRFLPFSGTLPNKAIFHSSYQRVALKSGVVNILTIHDLGYELQIMGTRWKRPAHIFFKSLAIKKAAGIICVSENTKKDLLRLYPYLKTENVKVIYNGVSDQFKIMPKEEYCLDLPKRYVLFVGTRDSYKNFFQTVEAVRMLGDYSLVIAGGRLLTSTERNFLDSRIGDRYTEFIKATGTELCELYNRAFCLIYPSSYEGFGIPVLEAMRCNCPVICCHDSSLPEVAGDAALYIEMPTPNAISDAVLKLTKKNERTERIEKGFRQSQKFSWDKCATQTISFYQEIFSKHHNRTTDFYR